MTEQTLAIEAARNLDEEHAALRTLLQRYETALAATPRSSTWGQEAQHLVEEIEAFLRRQHTQSHQVSRDPRDGFYLDTAERVWLRYDDLIGEITTIFGMRGSGKSNSVALIIEKLLQRNVPLSVIDPHGEYYSLRALPVSLLVVGITGGAASHPDLVIEPAYAAAVATFSVEQGISIILDLSGLGKQVRYEVLGYYFNALWTACARKKRIYHIVLEEAHAYIPQQGSSPVDEIVSDLSTEYRKFGVGMVIIDQRPVNVKKTPITQARVRILHEVDHPLDVERYMELVPKRYAKRMEEILASFGPGTALVKIHKLVDVIQVQTRKTIHVGVTPTLDGNTATIEIAHDDRLIQQLSDILSTVTPPERIARSGEGHKLQELQAQLAEAQTHTETLTHENMILREQIALLTTLRITSDGESPSSLPITLPTSLPIAEAIVEHVHLGKQTDITLLESTRASADPIAQLKQLQRKLVEQQRELEQNKILIGQLKDEIAHRQEQQPQPSTQERREDGGDTLIEDGNQANLKGKHESPASLPALLMSEQNLLTTFQKQVQALSASEKTLLTWLIEHDGIEMSSKQLANAVSAGQHIMRADRTVNLVKLPFITRGGTHQFWYKSTLGAYSHRHFSSVTDRTVIVNALIKSAQS